MSIISQFKKKRTRLTRKEERTTAAHQRSASKKRYPSQRKAPKPLGFFSAFLPSSQFNKEPLTEVMEALKPS